jgi:AbiU2
MTTESAEQVQEKHLRDMGPRLGPVYHVLYWEVAGVHAKWKQYRQLYGRSPVRIAFLNKVAGHFFGMVQHTLMDDVLLHLARLTDPPKSNRLTLKWLPKLAPDPTLRKEIDDLVRAAGSACNRVTISRNQRIAHTDFACAVGLATFDPIPPRADVEAALCTIRTVLHRLEMHFWQTKTAFEHVVPTGGDADSVVYYLVMAARGEEQSRERFILGKPLPGDYEPEQDKAS